MPHTPPRAGSLAWDWAAAVPAVPIDVASRINGQAFPNATTLRRHRRDHSFLLQPAASERRENSREVSQVIDIGNGDCRSLSACKGSPSEKVGGCDRPCYCVAVLQSGRKVTIVQDKNDVSAVPPSRPPAKYEGEVISEKRLKESIAAKQEVQEDVLGSSAIQNRNAHKKTYSTLTTNFSPTTTANLDQAVRRLTALSGFMNTKSKYAATLQGSAGGTLAEDVSALVTRWLNHTEPDAQLGTVFWPAEFSGVDYLELILQVISGDSLSLEQAIRNFPGHSISKASDMSSISDQEWISFFVNNKTLLPKFIPSGDTEDRARLYVQFLRTLLAVPAAPVPAVAATAGGIPTLGDYDGDILARLLSFVPGGFNLDNFSSDSTINLALISQPDQMTFALMEALFARGFRSIESVCNVSPDQVQIALQGTVAWTSASSIYYNTAVGLGHSFVDDVIPDPTFSPVNPGSVVNCVPPEHLSTFGPVKYLREAMDLTASGTVLGDVIKARRGDIASLIVSNDNFHVQVPKIDLLLYYCGYQRRSLFSICRCEKENGDPEFDFDEDEDDEEDEDEDDKDDDDDNDDEEDEDPDEEDSDNVNSEDDDDEDEEDEDDEEDKDDDLEPCRGTGHAAGDTRGSVDSRT
ncbi:hypothetical protein QBC43DRAFT_362574 [Cladorrhinum sp. PSN259]|nr:hypothetical protein QBC43DRAFT_362574 [Cladorrhinum sp. PSN259]